MHRLPSIVMLFFCVNALFAQSPHGEQLHIDCAVCHTTDSWEIDPEYSTFDHDSTRFQLSGQHEFVDCRTCHSTLIFDQAPLECASCHIDLHQQTVGSDCARCHDTKSWIVNNIPEIHEQISFPLIGVHAATDCFECHRSETAMRFPPIGVDCINCHQEDFDNTSEPDHRNAGYSTVCSDCHGIFKEGWGLENFVHSFFPLEQGHDIQDCATCHINPDYTDISADCVSCHLEDFNNTTDPNHIASGIPMDCAACHSLAPGWVPAEAADHDNSFPIYSGEHKGEWDACIDCHSDPTDFTLFNCSNCHKKDDMDGKHGGTGGYIFDNNACLECHPDGRAEGTFDHNSTLFPLTGGHVNLECILCHENGYEGTSTNCVDCHQKDYDATLDPNHVDLNLPMDCATCHTTDPEWNPASFDIHDDFHPLLGAHADIANDCAACHNGDYTNTPNTCIGCHQEEFEQTNEPKHSDPYFTEDCAGCHTEAAWVPAEYPHDTEYFPIYSGSHDGEWNSCTDCHINSADYTVFTCISCHTNPETDTKHDEANVDGYIYDDIACLACHPTGDADDLFDHNLTNFPLTGAHLETDCISCHMSGFEGTSTACVDCHQDAFNSTVNPPHLELDLSTDCASCHTTDPEWMPASFGIHDEYYPLTGGHAAVANDCAACHNGDYINTPNTCASCHQTNYDQTSNPNHIDLGFPTDCATCHTTDPDWMPADYLEHDNFYPLTGAHTTASCNDCHNGDYTNTPNTCAGCHQTDFDQTNNPNHTDLGFSTDCASCHTTDPEWMPADYSEHDVFYPLTGAHTTASCNDCHNGDYVNTPNTCAGCHQTDFDQTTEPPHTDLGFSTNCASCHTTDPDWIIENYLDHDLFYPLTGGHETVSCADCHNGDYFNTPNTCAGCHQTDFDQTNNPNHTDLGFSTDCATCHTVNPNWMPVTFDIHDDFYPLTGAHSSVANDCVACHNGDYNNTPNTCAGCHQADYDQSSNPNHTDLGLPTDCASCHTTDSDWMPASFGIHDDYYPLIGAHAPIANDCAACHNGDYINTPNTCAGCHQADFDQTSNPNHGDLGFPTDCASCHTTDPDWMPASFVIHDDYYPLTGAHATIANDCAACHNGDYTNTPNTCVGCHQNDYDQTSNPNHGDLGFPTDCASCHTTDPDWIPASYDDHNNFFPLTGAHTNVSCNECHNGDYVNTPNTCVGCHQSDFDQTSNPNHGDLGFSTDCASCHTTDPDWMPANYDDHDDFYPLSGAHVSVSCNECHNGDYLNTPNTCAGCHQTDYDQTSNPDHGALGLTTDCASCHTTDPDWMPASFTIHDDFYPLTGGHASIANDCAACHNGDYNNTPNTCVGCHQADYDQSSNPDHSALGFPTDCASCHTTDPDWMPATFTIHDDYYPLTGAHATIVNDCTACHNGDYINTPNTCVGCHQADYDQSSNPDHSALGFPTDCASCHTTDPDWMPATFTIHDDYYPLTGAHATIANDCTACHNGDYTNTPNTCVGCHTSDYNQTTNPDHGAIGIPTDCAMCHTTDPDWIPAVFPIHDDFYPLTGAHATISSDCAACHNGDYINTPNTCVACHQSDYDQTTNPNHSDLGFSTDCASCHTTDPDWMPASYDDHNDFYPLTGAHTTASCNDCHNGDYMNTPNTCVACHQSDYDQTSNPDHGALGFPTDCASCHTTDPNWVPATFTDHNGFYPLTGAHSAVGCNECHNGDYVNTPTTCAGCHTPDYNQTTNPNHINLGIPTDCDMCHTTDPNWMPATFPIHDDYYPLTGAHVSIADDCAVCHNGDYTNTPNTCAGCHTPDYNQTTNPDHGAIGIPTDCAMCHTTDPNWIPADFPIHDDYYPLTGAHSIIAANCADCHNGDYVNTPNTCAGCHTPDYDQTTNPDHGAIGIPTDCVMCHTTNPDWVPATFPIHDDYYPLNGAHAAIANNCIECHNGDYTNTPNTCVGCHQSDYDQTNNPNHAAANFPTDCTACHNENAWVPSTWDHDNLYFPIYSGKHDGEWNTCADCHTNSNDYSVFSCLGCHLQGQTDDDHDEVNGYMYESNACLSCHPDGED